MGGVCSRVGRAKVLSTPAKNSKVQLPYDFYQEYAIPIMNKADVGEDKTKIPGVLGTGAFSTVLKCIHKSTGDIRAVKFVEKKKMLGLRSRRAADKIVSELHRGIKLLRNLSHPGIIQFYDFYENNSAMAVVLEYGRGGELYFVIVKLGQLTELQTVAITKQLITAVSYLHSMGFVHRDIKPENVVLMEEIVDGSENFHVKLIDFGYSRAFSESQKMLSFVGTLNYVAPEIINRVPYDETVDIWSLGVIVFVLLQGYLPFELTEKFSTNKYELHFDPVDFRHISLQAKTLISRCLDISPHKRPSAKDLLLAPWLQESTHEGRQESRVPLNSPKKLASVVANNSSPKIFLGATELFPANHTEPSET